MADGTTQPTLIIPAFGGIYESLRKLTYPLIRVTTGLLLIPHGGSKLLGWFGSNIEGTVGFMAGFGLEPARFWAYYIGTLELVGGIMLVLGLLTRVVAIQVLIFMLVAAFWVHINIGPGAAGPIGNWFWITKGYEYPLMWAVLSLVVLIRGGGDYSVDKMIGKEF